MCIGYRVNIKKIEVAYIDFNIELIIISNCRGIKVCFFKSVNVCIISDCCFNHN